MATSSTASYPAPVGGLNARDPLANMPPTDAVIMDNWFPRPSWVEIRQGYANWVPNGTFPYASPVQTLMRYAPTTGSYKLFGATGTVFIDATASGAGSIVVTGLTNAQWQYTNIITPGGSYLWCVNGVDTPQMYNGAAWSNPAVTGVTVTNLVQVNVFGNRLFMVEKNTLKVWYLPVQSIAGAATAFDLSTIFTRGGYLMAMGTWSLDAGNGLNDKAVFISSEGEVAIYVGNDPTTWTKTGLFYIGRPIGRRCFTQMGGDFLLLCEQGIYPLSTALLSATIDRSVALTDKIQNQISQYVAAYENNFGWQMIVYPEQNQLWLNVPTGTSTSIQFVMNTITKAWARFTNMNAVCWEVLGPSIFYGGGVGGTGFIYKAWNGFYDGPGQIQADLLPAYSNFKGEAQVKYFTMVRPSMVATSNPSILFGLDLDFLNSPASGALALLPVVSGMIWGSMVWGPLMIWGGSFQQVSNWQTVGGVGRYASIRLTIQANGSQVQLNAVDYLYQRGGILS